MLRQLFYPDSRLILSCSFPFLSKFVAPSVCKPTFLHRGLFSLLPMGTAYSIDRQPIESKPVFLYKRWKNRNLSEKIVYDKMTL